MANFNIISPLCKPALPSGSLQRVVSYYPQVLTLHVKSVRAVVRFLREKCLFTVQQVTDILRDSPAVVHEDQGQLEYKFQVRLNGSNNTAVAYYV